MGRRLGVSVFVGLVICLAVAATVHAQECVSPPPGLVSWWPAIIDTTGDAVDIQGVIPNNGVLEGRTLIGAGKVGRGFHFDGVNDFIDIPTSHNLVVSTWTIEFWFYLNTISRSQAFVTNWDGTGSRYVIEFLALGKNFTSMVF